MPDEITFIASVDTKLDSCKIDPAPFVELSGAKNIEFVVDAALVKFT